MIIVWSDLKDSLKSPPPPFLRLTLSCLSNLSGLKESKCHTFSTVTDSGRLTDHQPMGLTWRWRGGGGALLGPVYAWAASGPCRRLTAVTRDGGSFSTVLKEDDVKFNRPPAITLDPDEVVLKRREGRGEQKKRGLWKTTRRVQ